MFTLFPLEDETQRLPNIAGLSYLPEYVSAAEEAELVRQIDAGVWDTSWERRRQAFGASYGKADGTEKPLPD